LWYGKEPLGFNRINKAVCASSLEGKFLPVIDKICFYSRQINRKINFFTYWNGNMSSSGKRLIGKFERSLVGLTVTRFLQNKKHLRTVTHSKKTNIKKIYYLVSMFLNLTLFIVSIISG
jgi:hypothetical protein